LFNSYKHSAKDRGIAFRLSKPVFRNLTSARCHYCGAIPNRFRKNKNCRGSYRYNGVDRKNNEQGYVSRNVVPCCFTCNDRKSTTGYRQFVGWIRRANRWLAKGRNK
jgi:hypothetical protein